VVHTVGDIRGGAVRDACARVSYFTVLGLSRPTRPTMDGSSFLNLWLGSVTCSSAGAIFANWYGGGDQLNWGGGGCVVLRREGPSPEVPLPCLAGTALDRIVQVMRDWLGLSAEVVAQPGR
jgi:hypothetical protein